MKNFLPVRCIGLIWPRGRWYPLLLNRCRRDESTLNPEANSLAFITFGEAAAPPATNVDIANALSIMSKFVRRAQKLHLI
jgi:hypothetical protein